jgi:hypothetical protein
MKGTSDKDTTDRRKQAAALGNMLKAAIEYSIPGIDFSDIDMDNLTQLCAMSTVPTGDEDPKTLIRPLSDLIVNSIVIAAKTSITNPILGRLVKIFYIEWCFRHGKLEEDWRWEWKGPTQGDMHFRPKEPLEELKVPA